MNHVQILRAGIALVVTSVACAAHQGSRRGPVLPLDTSTTVVLGSGHYATRLPRHEPGPSNFRGEPVTPKVTADFKRPPTSNDWWSSLIWQFDREGKSNPYSEPMFAHPLAMQAAPGGLVVCYPAESTVKARSFFYPFHADLTMGVEGLTARETRVADYSDWTVTASWQAGDKELRATFGHGLPYVYATVRGGPAVVSVPEGTVPHVWSVGGSTMGLTVNGHHYGLFAPRGATWLQEGGRFVSELGGKGFFSIAVLPDDRAETLALFRKHAHTVVTETRVDWRYEDATAQLAATYTASVTMKERGPDIADTPLMALYPHQWRNTEGPFVPVTYASARGLMKTVAARSFRTRSAFHGVLPMMPLSPSPGERARIRSLLETGIDFDDLFPAGMENTRGTYWTGKSLQRLALHAQLADALGDRVLRDRLIGLLKRELEVWFDGQAPEYFSYHDVWRTLIGVPSEYRAGWELNDHHFHYAYFILAAATVARFDPSWAAKERYGGMVDLLIRDCANTDRADHRFPFLRWFDPYAGHSWANGPALFTTGNNEESSSEDVNFAWATILWGAATSDQRIRDMGIFLYATLTSAIDQYWFDVDRSNFPKGFDKPAVGIVWGSGGTYETWWDRNPIYVHGINFLPVTGGSLYLGAHPDYVRRNHDRLVAENRGEALLWRDVIWMHLAFADADKAVALYEADSAFEPEFGNSLALTAHHLYGLRALGAVDVTVAADHPYFGVFTRAGQRTHVAFNPTASPIKVAFSDGTHLTVPALTLTDDRRAEAP